MENNICDNYTPPKTRIQQILKIDPASPSILEPSLKPEEDSAEEARTTKGSNSLFLPNLFLFISYLRGEIPLCSSSFSLVLSFSLSLSFVPLSVCVLSLVFMNYFLFPFLWVHSLNSSTSICIYLSLSTIYVTV